jgi:hypothetical protein
MYGLDESLMGDGQIALLVIENTNYTIVQKSMTQLQ